MSKGIAFCLKGFGSILSIVTTIFTVILWASLPTDIYSQILMGIAGFALEGSKFLLLVLALLFFRRKYFSASITGAVLSFLLFVVSIGASIGFLESSEQQQQHSSQAWQDQRKQLAMIDLEIESLLSSINDDINNGYRDRGLKTRKEVAKLKQERKALLATETYQADSSFSGLAGLMGMNNNSIRLVAWLVLAILIDGVAAACWVFLALLEPETVPETLPETTGKNEKQEEQVLSSSQDQNETIKQPDDIIRPAPPEDKPAVKAVYENSYSPLATPETENRTDSREPETPDFFKTTKETTFNCTATEKTSTEVVINNDNNRDYLYEQVKQKILAGTPGYTKSLSLNRLMRLESIGYAKARRVMDKIQQEQLI